MTPSCVFQHPRASTALTDERLSLLEVQVHAHELKKLREAIDSYVGFIFEVEGPSQRHRALEVDWTRLTKFRHRFDLEALECLGQFLSMLSRPTSPEATTRYKQGLQANCQLTVCRK